MGVALSLVVFSISATAGSSDNCDIADPATQGICRERSEVGPSTTGASHVSNVKEEELADVTSVRVILRARGRYRASECVSRVPPWRSDCGASSDSNETSAKRKWTWVPLTNHFVTVARTHCRFLDGCIARRKANRGYRSSIVSTVSATEQRFRIASDEPWRRRIWQSVTARFLEGAFQVPHPDNAPVRRRRSERAVRVAYGSRHQPQPGAGIIPGGVAAGRCFGPWMGLTGKGGGR